MKTHVSYQIAFVGLMLLSLASCKKENPTVPPAGTILGATKSSAKEILPLRLVR